MVLLSPLTLGLAWLVAVLGPAFAPDVNRKDAGGTLWTFHAAQNRLEASIGAATLEYYDPDGTGWGPRDTRFGTASGFGLPAMPGGDPAVMRIPALTANQGYRLTHNAPSNGAFRKSHGLVSNYTLIFDVLYPSESDGQWRALYQTSDVNANDADFFVHNTPSGGVGANGIYHGSVRPNTWHRLAIVVQAAPEEGKAQRFIDGRFVGGIGTTDVAALGIRWALAPSFLLFSDAEGQKGSVFVSSLYFIDRALPMDQIRALGGPHAAGALTPGAPPPALDAAQRLPATVGSIGHRGGFFCCAPDNTMAAVRMAIDHGIPAIEIDTRLSADGVGVLVHDATVDRTTNGTGPVAALSAAQLKALDAGSWFAPEFAGERVPTMAEVMREAKAKLVLYFDLKVTGQIDAILAAMKETGFPPDDSWFWVYGDEAEAAAIRARLPDAKIIWSVPPQDWAEQPDLFPAMRAAGIYGFDLAVEYVDAHPDFVRAAKAAGFMISVHVVMDPDQMRRAAALGVDYIQTDFPQIVHELRK